MSAQPLSMPRKEEAARKKKEWKSDALYFSGAALITAGVAMIRIRYGLICAGSFLVLIPFLELASSFIRGVRPRR